MRPEIFCRLVRRQHLFLLHICKTLIDDDSQIVTSAERADALFGGDCRGASLRKIALIRGWAFYGVLDRLDFRGIVFEQCRFESVTFRNCNADESTHFRKCEFTGDLDIRHSPARNWSKVQIQECRMSFPTDVVWGEILGKRMGTREETNVEGVTKCVR